MKLRIGPPAYRLLQLAIEAESRGEWLHAVWLMEQALQAEEAEHDAHYGAGHWELLVLGGGVIGQHCISRSRPLPPFIHRSQPLPVGTVFTMASLLASFEENA